HWWCCGGGLGLRARLSSEMAARRRQGTPVSSRWAVLRVGSGSVGSACVRKATAGHGGARQRCSEVHRGGAGRVRRRERRRVRSRLHGAPRVKLASAKAKEDQASAHRGL